MTVVITWLLSFSRTSSVWQSLRVQDLTDAGHVQPADRKHLYLFQDNYFGISFLAPSAKIHLTWQQNCPILVVSFRFSKGECCTLSLSPSILQKPVTNPLSADCLHFLALKTHFTFNLLYLFFSFQAISVEPSLIFCLSIAVNIVTLPAVHAKKPL